MKNSFTKICLLLLAGGLIAGCSDDDPAAAPPTPTTSLSKAARSYSGEMTRDYYDLLCTVTKATPGFSPVHTARAYSYISITAYETVVAGIPGAKSLAGQLNALSASALPKTDTTVEYNWAIASNAGVSEMMRKMFEKRSSAGSVASIDSMEQAQLAAHSVGIDQAVIDRSVAYGRSIAAALYQYSTTDGGHEGYLDPSQQPYTPPTDSNCWVPTSAVKAPVGPKWGSCRPFMAMNVSATNPTPPVPFSSSPTSQFYEEAMVVYNQVNNNTHEQVDIAQYWADDPFKTCTPTGHTFNILSQLLEEDHATLEKTSVAYAMLGIAENDAFIACWKSKYDYVLIRPVSYIQRYIDSNFRTVIGTPPFPAYTSGHSAEIGSGIRIFTRLFTDGSGDYDFTDYSHLRFGFAVRNFSNFNDMGMECANSRLYGGIHYPMDNLKGLQIGKAVGDNVHNMLQWPQDIQ